MCEEGCTSLAREADVEFQDASHWRDGSSGAEEASKQAKHLKVDHVYVQTISVKITDRLFKVN